MLDRPTFPLDLSILADAATIATLRPAELGALIRLAAVAWLEEPPATLPDDDARLAVAAGQTPDEWASTRPAVLRAFRPDGAGRLASAALAAAYVTYSERTQRRSAAGRIAANARHSGGPGRGGAPPPLRIASESHANRMRTASGSQSAGRPPHTPPASERSALLRSTPPEMNPSAPCAPGGAGSNARGVGAGARALEAAEADTVRQGVEALRRQADAREVEDILRRAYWPHAPEDRRTVPPKLAAELARSRHSRPVLAFYAVRQIADRASAARSRGEACNTLGLLVSAFGAQRHGRGRPWEVPALFVQTEWEARAKERAEADRLQQTVEALRARQAGASPATRAL